MITAGITTSYYSLHLIQETCFMKQHPESLLLKFLAAVFLAESHKNPSQMIKRTFVARCAIGVLIIYLESAEQR